MHGHELPVDRLTTTDEKGGRVYVYPADVRGFWRIWRDRFYYALLAAYFGLPWVRLGGHPLFLFDIPSRRFIVFGATFWAHDAPMIVFLIAGFAIALFFATAILGRVWCGWACPQTVFIDAVFRRIERWIEGDSVARRRRDQRPWTKDKILRRAAKWALFTLATLAIVITFLAYFIGTDQLAGVIRSWPGENQPSFITVLILSGIVLFDFGWFREQFCVIACPYGRFQSVLMDDHSMIVGYDPVRGEPRWQGLAAQSIDHGDCINCYRCVDVCPTGIDIRRGVQMECIACTACADACDEMMFRLKKPQGLIRYTSLDALSGKPWRPVSARTVGYSVALLAYLAGLAYRIHSRRDLYDTFVRYTGTPYTLGVSPKTGVPEVENRYEVDFSDQGDDDIEIRFQTPPEDHRGIAYIAPMVPTTVHAGTSERTDLFVRFPRSILKDGAVNAQIEIIESDKKTKRKTSHREDLKLVGPY